MLAARPAQADDGFDVRAHASLILDRARGPAPASSRAARARASGRCEIRVALCASREGRAVARDDDIVFVALHDYDGRRGFELWALLPGAGSKRVCEFLPEADLLTTLEAWLRVRDCLGFDAAGGAEPARAAGSARARVPRGRGGVGEPWGGWLASPPAAGHSGAAIARDPAAVRRALAREWALLEGGPGTLSASELGRMRARDG